MATFLEFISYAFIQRAIIAGVFMSIVGAILGVFVILRRMSFFSDAIAHASLSGVAIGLLLHINPTLGAIGISVMIGVMMGALIRHGKLSSDTIIGVLFSSSIAFAIFIISLLPGIPVDINSLLFGDILSVLHMDVYFSIVLFAAALIFCHIYLRTMLKMIFSLDLAMVENKGVITMDYLFLTLLALTIAVSLKMIGAILVSALIIIPAAAAQNISNNIRQMFFWAGFFGILSVVSGMFLSYIFNTPSGATIVLSASLLFIVTLLFKNK